MKVLILFFTFVSFSAFTGAFEECEIFSEKAKVIMELRQNKNSINLVISEIDKKYIIIGSLLRGGQFWRKGRSSLF